MQRVVHCEWCDLLCGSTVEIKRHLLDDCEEVPDGVTGNKKEGKGALRCFTCNRWINCNIEGHTVKFVPFR